MRTHETNMRMSLSAPLSSVIGLQFDGLLEALLSDLSLLHDLASLITCPEHLHNVETHFYCPQTFLSFDFPCRNDVSELK
jgi:hypothetical protein